MSSADNRLVLTGVATKYTNIPFLPSMIVGMVCGSITIALAYLANEYIPYIYALIMERGTLQFITIYTFWFTAGMLFFKYRNLLRERSAFSLEFITSFTGNREMMGAQTFIGEHAVLAENLKPDQKDLLLVNRINKAIKQVKINNNPADVANVLKTVAETDSGVIDSSSILIRYMIWAIPILGFIGTILGMTQAIGSFDTVLKGIGEVGFSGVQENLGLVTSGLAVAFETTFLALILSATANLFFNIIQKKEEDLLSDVEEFTTDNIINKYTLLKEQLSTPKQDTADGEIMEDILMELKNMNRQNQVNNDELLVQLGKMIETLELLQQIDNNKKSDDPVDFTPLLKEIAGILQGQARFVEQMAEISKQLQHNSTAMDKLPETIDRLDETSRKLGELLSKIYNRTFE